MEGRSYSEGGGCRERCSVAEGRKERVVMGGRGTVKEGMDKRNITEGVLSIMHVRSLQTIDPRIPTKPGWNTSGFAGQADIACAKSEAMSGESFGGELQPTKNRL